MAEVNEKWDGCVTGRIRRPAGAASTPDLARPPPLNLPVGGVW